MANATTFNRILSKGIESELPKVVDGRLRFTTDTGRLFLDNGNERVEISDFVKGQTSTQITGTLAPLPKFYLASDTNVLYFYAGGQWNTVKAANASTADYSNNASTANYAKNAINTITRSGNTFTATRFDGTTFTFSQQNSTYTNGEGLSLSNGTFSINKNASTVAYATKAGSASSATNATNAGSATNAGTANFASTAANGIENITRSGKTFTVTRQDGSTFTFDQQDDNQTYKAGEGLSLNTGTFSINKDASTVKYATQAGSAANATCATNASSVNGFTVGKSVPSNAVFTDTTYSVATGGGLTLSSGAFSINKDASTVKYATNSGTATYATNAGSADNATCATNASSVGGFTVGKSVPSNAVFTDTTYANVTSAAAGLAPAGGSGTTKYLRQDGSWQVPPDNNTTYPSFSTASNGLVNKPTNATTAAYLKGNNTWAIPTASEVGAIATTAKGAANGVAELDSSGKVPSTQLPSYVDDVIEGYYYNGKFYKEAAHTTEIPGESGKIYVDLSTDKTYRWGGSSFVVISETLALGETSSTAYRGDRGKIAYDHSQAAHAPSNAQPNQNAFSNVKVGSTTIAADTTTDTLELVAGSNVTLTPDATNDKVTITATDTTYSNMTSAAAGLAPAGGSGTTKYLRQDGTWAIPPDNNTTYTNGTGLSLSGNTFSINQNASTVAYATNAGSATSAANAACATNSSSVSGFTVGKSVPANAVFTDTTYANVTSAAAGLAPAGGSGTTKYLRQDGTWQVPPDNNTTYGNATTATAGLLPTLAGGTEKYLRADGTWVKPPNDNTTYGNMTSAAAGLAPAGGSGTTKYLRQDGTWQVPPDNDTKNTAGSTDTSSKIFLIGATSQGANPQTYSHDTAYVGTDGCLYSGGIKVLTAETDPTVPSWAKASSKPTYTASEVGALSTAVKGAVNGVAELDSAGKVPSSQLPSYVDDVIEGYYYNSKFYKESAHTTEITPESGKIYVDLSTDKTYRWSGTAYTQIKGDLALGETSTTAYRGDRGKIAYDHSQAAHAPSNAQPNQNAFSNVKVGSTTIAADTTTDTLEIIASGGITLTPDATNDKLTISSTTYGNMTSAAAGLAPAGGSGTTKYLRQDGSWQVPPNDNTTYGTFSTAANGLVPKPASAATTSYLNSSGTWTTPVGTTYSAGTGISISTAKAISLATTGTAGTYGPSANVTGNEGATISVPQITTDSYGRVTSVTNRTYTSKNTTYDLSAATVNTSTYSNRPMVEADFDFGELNSTTPGDESYNS